MVAQRKGEVRYRTFNPRLCNALAPVLHVREIVRLSDAGFTTEVPFMKLNTALVVARKPARRS